MNQKIAPLSRRFGALALDYLVIVGYGLLLLASTLLLYQIVFGGIPDVLGALGPLGTQTLAFVTLTLPVGLYFYLTESSPRHATLGKRAAKIKVSAINRTPTKKQIALRTIMKFLPWEFAHTFVHQIVYFSQNGGTPPLWVMIGITIANLLPLIYVATILFRKDHRGPHDLVAGTVVVLAK